MKSATWVAAVFAALMLVLSAGCMSSDGGASQDHTGSRYGGGSGGSGGSGGGGGGGY